MLSRRNLMVARAFAEALFSGPNGPPPASRLDWLQDDFADFTQRAGPRARLLFSLFLTLVTLIAPILIGRLPGLRRLTPADRVRALAKMEASWASGPVLAIKAMLCVLWYEHPDSAAEVGFTGAGALAPGETLAPRERALG